eukprot:TRINITY_DN6405_c1_g1_i2.p1 TRINITY_DN6405_c1_g1~~TRINITY_DN6405_c1_g1_i2.p1  ORF type:complete len:437 (-),score=115.48 TRINITY_DN6405_c1_g1_i2:139-1449(-)
MCNLQSQRILLHSGSLEFLQAEELFDQASNVTNCLRDNRFCGVSNSFVKRHANGKPVSIVPSQPKNGLEVKVPSKNNGVLQVPSVPPPQQRPVQQPSPKIGLQSSTIGTTDGKGESNAHAPEVHAQAGKPHIDKEKSTTLPAYKKKGQNEKNSPGTGASLANLWGRASAKSKSSCPPTETTNDDPLPAITAEAQICAREAADTVSSDDDGHDINCKRDSNGGSSRKRRVVFDFSDDEDDNENVVSLASPDPPKKQPILDSKCNTENLVLEKKDLNFEREGGKLEIKQEKTAEIDFGLPLKEDAEGASKSKTSGSSFSKRIQSHISEGGADNNKKDKATDAASTSPKRRKVLKTRIDERGREVTEVVWEGEDANSSKTDKNATTNSAENRLPPANKAPALGSTGPSNPVGKAGNKKTAKGGGKDAKQGNILSFFKKA